MMIRFYGNQTKKSKHFLYFSLFLFLLALYLLTYTPRINSSDGLAMFSTAESLVRQGGLDIEQIRWMDLQQGTYGLDGYLYSRKGIGVPIGMLFLTWLGFFLPGVGPLSVSLLFNALVTALTAVLLMAYIRELGFQTGVGLIVALTFGVTTLAWPYAKSLFSDPFSGLLLLAAAYSLLKMEQRPLFFAFLAGLFLGWNVATRYAEAIFLPLFGLLWYHYHRSDPKSGFWSSLLAFGSPIFLIGFSLMAFNLSRYGDPLDTGYLPNESFSGVWWRGIVGQLISPGRGLLLYCPIFLFSFWGMLKTWSRFRAETVLTLGIILIHLLLYGKWFMWHGGYAWGPRFMVPTLPFWAILLAPGVKTAFFTSEPPSRWKLRASYLFLAGLGLVPQFLSNVIDFTSFQNSLLEGGLELYAPQTFFELQYSPFVGAWAFIHPDTLDLAWFWQGKFQGGLFILLLFNIVIAAISLYYHYKKPLSARNHLWSSVTLLSTVLALTYLLIHTHTLSSQSLQQAVAVLNQKSRAEDAIITNDPEIAQPFAELYQGRATVLGLNRGGPPLSSEIEQRLHTLMATHQQIWWLPNWLPTEESAVEQTLLRDGFMARSEQFEDQRLVLFAYPQEMIPRPLPAPLVFEEGIQLDKILTPALNRAGSALPVALHWQKQGEESVRKDYHVFIHLVSQTGLKISQADGQPVHWTRPTTTWQPDETIVDRYGLWLPTDLEPGSYLLRIGLYHPAEGERLPLLDGTEVIETEIYIEKRSP